MKRFHICLLLLLSMVCVSVQATERIKGKLVETGKLTPVEFADVMLFQAGNKTAIAHVYSQQDGSFSFTNLKDGNYVLVVKVLGYDVHTRPDIVLTSTSSKPIDLGRIEMTPLETGLGEVVIEAEKRQVIYKLDKRVIDGTSNLMGTGGSAVDVLQNAPSIRIDAEGQVTFRGSSGFAVYVDGKPSVFSGTQALQQIPAGFIENIEIITTPSARHDTGGDVGIINIITKKHMRQGLTGMVNVGGSTVLSNNVDFLITNKEKAFGWYVAGAWSQPIRKSDFDQRKTTIVDGLTTESHSNGPRRGKNYHYNLRGGVNYALPKTDLNLDLEIGYNKFTRDGDLYYTEKRTNQQAAVETNEYYSRDDYDLHSTHNQGSVGFNHRFNEKGHKLSGGFMLRYEGDALEYFQSDLFDMKNERQQGHRAWEIEKRWTVLGNLDYILPYSENGKLEGGYQYFSYLEDGDYKMEFWDPAKKEFYWRDDIYNTFYFQRGIHSIYGIVSQSFSSFEMQVGLRGEHTHQVLRSSIKGSDRTRNYFEVFPSVHLGYNLPHNQKLLASYSYRTNRPQLFFMEPYITYRDYYTAEIGNPDIRPEYIHSYELNYRKTIDDHVLSASVFYRNRKDKIERLRVPFEAGVTLDSMANVGHDYSMGVELNAQVQLRKWWSVNLNGNMYHYKVKNELKLNGNNEKSTNYDITLNNVFDITKTTRLQLDGNFVGPTVTTQGRNDSFWFVNFAIKQQLLRNKLSSTLSFRDVFNSARYRSEILRSDLTSITNIRPHYPVITLTLSYTFNNFKKQSSDSRDNRDLFEGVKH